MENAIQMNAAPVPQPTSAQKNKNIYSFIIGFAVLVVILLAAIGAVGTYQVYAHQSQNPLALAVAKVLHLPAFKINGAYVDYMDYVTDLKANTLAQNSAQAQAAGAKFTPEQLSDQVMIRLANNVLLTQAAKTYEVKVEDKDLAPLRQQIVAKFGSKEAAEQQVKQLFGWSMDTYEKRVIMPDVLQNKLNDTLSTNQAAKDAVRAKAEDVLKQLKAGADFATLAKQYGEDGTASQGGELGYFGRGEMVPQFETAAFALKKGETSAQLVETSYGYHIINVEDKRTEKSKDASGKAINADQVKARHILLRFPSLDQYMVEAVKNSKVKLYLKVHNPFIQIANEMAGEAANTTTPAQP